MKAGSIKTGLLLCFFAAGCNWVTSQTTPLTQRQIALNEISTRPNDPWPRGDGHVLLAEPGSPLAQKGYHEPGGSFSPAPGSFGLAIWILDGNNKLVATSDDIPVEKITQQYIWKEGSKIPSIKTETPYYNCTWSYSDMGAWKLELTKTGITDHKLWLVVRSTGPAGGPVNSAVWDKTSLILNRRWKVIPDVQPLSIALGDEEKGQLFADNLVNDAMLSPNGWAFARIEINAPTFAVRISDSKPVFRSPLTYEKTEARFQFNVPDKRFKESLNAQIATLMMGYIGRQTGPGEPVNYPLAWERDGAYSLMAMAKSGNLETARELSVYFAENDFFGGFGAEGDAPGSAINALAEVAFLLDDPAYYQWVWPHIQRKLGYIDEMMTAEDNLYKNFLGPLVPTLESDLKRRQLICLKRSEEGLIYGTMDGHFPVLYINALSYRASIQASRLATRLGEPEIAAQCIGRAEKIKAAWLKGFGQEKYDNERNFMISVWPTWTTDINNDFYLQKIQEQRTSLWKDGAPKERPMWTYFTVAEAHQWLFLGRPDLTWETLTYFWNNQCSPGLYTYWEGNGEENSFHGWDQYRGWFKPKYVTPHYWTASEMVHLQLDMLIYFDESGTEPVLVVGGGIPKNWVGQKMNVDNYKTRYGTITWSYENNKLNVTVKGAKGRYDVRTGPSLAENVKLEVMFK